MSETYKKIGKVAGLHQMQLTNEPKSGMCSKCYFACLLHHGKWHLYLVFSSFLDV